MSAAIAFAPQAAANIKKAAAAGGSTTKNAGDAPSSMLMGEYISLDKRMTVSKNVVDELLLVCGVIGTETENNNLPVTIVPVTDCLNWLQDLQRALRRDDDLYRPISILLGDWKVAQQKLLPLVLSCRYDTPMVLTVCKILVILTKPLSENTVRAGRMVIDTKKHPEDFVKEQIKLRENALKQADTLMEYKRVICHHPSHINTSSKKSKDGQGGILSIFVSLLAEPLSKTGTARTDIDHLTIELVLHLFRNLLQAEPLLLTSSESVYKAKQLHNELISLLGRELVLEILLVLGADLESRENQPYNLLVMELLHHLLRHQDPTSVARSQLSPLNAPNNKPSSSGSALSSSHRAAAAPSRLKQQLARERQAIHQVANASGRHSHFGGKLVVSRDGGAKKQLISAAKAGEKRRDVSAGAERRRNKKMEPFIGNSKASSAAVDDGCAAAGPAQLRAWKTLDNFCVRFVTDCYGPVMKSLKNEFRRDSVRLEENDRAVFFRIVWFFCQWYRLSGKKRLAAAEAAKKKAAATTAVDGGDNSSSSSPSSSSSSSLGQLIFTMDIFSFKLVHDAIDHFQQHKKYPRLAQSVALLSEMMHLLHAMCTSKESTEQVMALGLMDRLFYAQDPVDCLPKLLSTWQPGTSTRGYLCDLVELCHMTLKLLEVNAKACEEEAVIPASKSMKKGKKKGDDDDEVDAKKFDTIAKMKAASADFDVTTYLARKIISNHTVSMYTHLLSQYASNAPHTNHRIMALFLRLAKIKIAQPDDSDPDLPKNLLATKMVTLEPMLFNIQLIIVLDKILNDKAIRNDKNFASLLTFASTVIHNFAKATKSNPLLFVEALFKHPLPHRFCEFAINMYVSEELRMIAERELLLEEQKRLEDAAGQDGDDDNEEDDDEDELEFEDFGTTSAPEPTRKTKKKVKKKRKTIVEGSDDSDGESDDDDDDANEGGGGDVPSKKKNVNNTKSDESSDDDDDLFSSSNKASSPRNKNKEGNGVNLKRALEDSGDEVDSSDVDNDTDLFGPSSSNKPTTSTGDHDNHKKKPRLSTDDNDDEAHEDAEESNNND